MENPPLWVWAIVVSIIIASKFIYRWKATNQIANSERKTKVDYTAKSTNARDTYKKVMRIFKVIKYNSKFRTSYEKNHELKKKKNFF